MKKNEEQTQKKKGNLFSGILNKGNFLKDKLTKAFKNPNNENLNNKEIKNNKKEEETLKAYNIQISEGNDNNVFEINDEEEEEEYEIVNEENNKKEEKKENEIKNFDEEINIKVNKNENEKRKLEEKKPSESFCHYIFLKGSLIIKDNKFQFFEFFQLIRKNILRRIVFMNKKENKNENEYTQKPYLCFFDENFIYFLEDKIINKKEPNLRKIAYYYNLFKINDFSIVEIEENKKIKINLSFILEGKKLIKQLLFEKEKGNEFINNLNNSLKKFNIKI